MLNDNAWAVPEIPLWQKSPMAISHLTSPLLERAGFRHAFFTRHGGVSDGAFRSLNFAVNQGDSPENVRENLERAGTVLGVPGHRIFFLSQVHGTVVHEAREEDEVEAFSKREGDIVLSQGPRRAAAIRTADCLPILLACRETGWVAACHSGWQGCERGAAIAAVHALRERGAKDLIAAIGPHISAKAFEVGQDVGLRLEVASPDSNILERHEGRIFVNLQKMVEGQLRQQGLSASLIDVVEGCTLGDSERFFSYRRDKNPSGRMLSAIVGRLGTGS